MTGSEWWAAAPDNLASDAYIDHVLNAIEQGWLYWRWTDLQIGPMTVQVMTQPLAVGTAEDHVFLYGMTAKLLDGIVAKWNRGSEQHDRYCLAPRFVMPLTSLVLDALAADARTVLVGPFTDTPGSMSKDDAKRHSDRLKDVQRQWASDPAYWGGAESAFWLEGKTYTLRSPHKAGLANEYGWHVASGWSPSATELFRGTQGIPRVIQPEAYAHSYGAFQDYSMMCMLMGAYGTLMGYGCPGCSQWHAGNEDGWCSKCGEELDPLDPALRVDLRDILADPERCHLVTVHQPQDWYELRGPA